MRRNRCRRAVLPPIPARPIPSIPRSTNQYLYGYALIITQRLSISDAERHDVLFKTLADPTRRAIFERLCRRRQTVGALTAQAGVSQPSVSKHLGVLKQAGLVRDRHKAGRRTIARSSAPWPRWSTGPGDGGVLAEEIRRSRRSTQTDGPITNTATETCTVVVEREMPHAGEALARADATAFDEEWLMKSDFKPVVATVSIFAAIGRRAGLEVLAIEPNKALSYTWNLCTRMRRSICRAW